MNNFTQLKKSAILIVFAVFFIGTGVFAQSPNSFKYQAVLRDLDGKVLANKAAAVEISILQGSTSGTSVITEVFNVTTNMYGLTNLEIGSVNPAAFSAIDWGDGPYFIKVSVDGDVVGTSQLLSVPYALHAGAVDNVDDADADPTNELQDITLVGNQLTLSMGSTVTLPGTDFDGDYSSLAGAPTNLSDFTNDTGFITNPDDADANPANELQILSITGNQLTLSDGNTVTLPGSDFDGDYSSLVGAPTNLSDFSNDTGFITNPNDADSNPVNEIQILSINGHQLTLSNGGTVTLPDGFDGMYSSLTGTPANLSDFANDIGYLTNPDDADSDPANELQNLIKIGNVVSLSNGGGAFVDSALTEAQVDAMVANNGYQSIYELGSMIYQDSISVNIEGGEIDGTVIGLNAPEEGYFQNIDVNKNIYLPKTTVDEGVVYVDDKRFIHSNGAQSTYIGEEAGQLAGYGSNDNIGVGYKALSNNVSGHSNVAVGSGVMAENGIGTQNVAVGQEAMMSNTTGSYNTSAGAYSMTSNTDGSYNIAVGFESLKSNTQGSNNIGVGIRALNNNLVGNGNIAVGYNSLYNNTTGEQNIAIGSTSMNKNIDGKNNTATGSFSLNNNTSGNGNVANGHQALYNNTTGDQNVAIGDGSLYSNTTAVEITAVGYRSLYSNTTGIGNTAVGARSLNSNTEGYANTATGTEVLMDNTTGFDNTGVGLRSLVRNTEGNHNTGVGAEALYDNTVGDFNSALGSEALYNNVFGNYNTAAGYSALYENQEGTNNTAVGNRASNFNAGGDYNTAIGDSSMYNNRPGSYNTALGKEALFMNRTSSTNVALGAYSMYNQLTGEGNTATGYAALYNNKTGNENTAVGDSALFNNTSSQNTGLGSKALYNNTGGTGNTGVGSRILYNNTGGNKNAALGDSALYINSTGSRNTGVGSQALRNNNANENTAVGTQALYSNTYGTPNTAVGAMSLRSNTTGANNAAVGDSALFSNSTGVRNSAVGSQALRNNTASENTAIGTRALYSNTDGINNAAVGDNALYSNLIGARNAAVGSQALMNNTANDNTAIGSRSLYSNTTGTNNAAVGDSALYSNLTGSRNAAVGSQALRNNLASENTAVGTRALYSNTDGVNNAAVGDYALYSNKIGTSNSAIGSQALMNNTANGNTAVGTSALYSNTDGANNVAVGDRSLYTNLTGEKNTGIGTQALFNNLAKENTSVGFGSMLENINGNANTAMGFNALSGQQEGIFNVAIGYQAMTGADEGGYNVGVGLNALYNNRGGNNTATGSEALYSNTTASQNSAFGNRALYSNTTGAQNTAVGDSSLVANTTGLSNTAVGYRSLRSNSTGNYNTAMGQNALLMSTGNSNTALGDLAGSGLTSGDGNLFLGFQAAKDTASSSNKLFINNDEADLNLKFLENAPPLTKGALIYGEFDNEYLRFDADLDLNGKLAIKNSSQSTEPDNGALTVTGGVGIGRRLNVGEESTFEKQVIIGAAAPSVDTMDINSIAVSSNMLIVDGNASIGNGYINELAPANGLLVEGNFGLGVPAPTSKMQIAGNIAPDLTTNLRTLGTPSERWTTLYMASIVDYANELKFHSASGDQIKFATNGNATFNANVGIGVAAGTTVPTAVGPTSSVKLHVKGSSTEHIAFFENTNTGDGDGIAIKVGRGTPSVENNYISFLDGSGNIIGRVEGETANDLWSNPEYLVEYYILVAEEAKAIVNQGTSFIPVVVAGLGASAGPCGACIAAAAADLILATANLASFIAFANTQLGVTYQSGGADYAEWLERENPGEQISAGEIVRVNSGKISKVTTGAQKYMVVSTNPVILGNMPKEGSESLYEKVAFMGQIPVKVRGIVAAGEYIIPSGLNDGTGIAVSPDDIKPEQYKEIVGVAWSNSLLSDGVSSVNMAIGLNSNDVAHLAVKQEKKINELEKKYSALEDRLLALETGTVTPTEKSAGLKSAAIEPEPEPEAEPEMTRLEMLETYMPSELSSEVMEDAMIYLEGEFASQGISISDHPGLNKLFTDASYREEIIKKAQANYIVTYNKLLQEAKDNQ